MPWASYAFFTNSLRYYQLQRNETEAEKKRHLLKTEELESDIAGLSGCDSDILSGTSLQPREVRGRE